MVLFFDGGTNAATVIVARLERVSKTMDEAIIAKVEQAFEDWYGI